MFDLSRVKRKASDLLGSATRTIKTYSPDGWVPEKLFVNAISASMALMVIADKKIETEEVEDVMQFIIELPQVQDLNLTTVSIELFEMHLDSLEKVMHSQAKYIIATTKVLAEIAKVKKHTQYVPIISDIMDHIAGSDGNVDDTEREMKRRIMAVLK
jgi:tellurite resistance protein